ncbi:hypothetical protein HDV05_003345 [Chytridiales sp. JEL 0842]|nr:hypothetical protein HDV05_003345 [Chytridiales sp. JEL 0842]
MSAQQGREVVDVMLDIIDNSNEVGIHMDMGCDERRQQRRISSRRSHSNVAKSFRETIQPLPIVSSSPRNYSRDSIHEDNHNYHDPKVVIHPPAAAVAPSADPPITYRPDSMLPDILEFIIASEASSVSSINLETGRNSRYTIPPSPFARKSSIPCIVTPKDIKTAFSTLADPTSALRQGTDIITSPPPAFLPDQTKATTPKSSSKTPRKVRAQQAREMQLPYCVTSHRKFFGGGHFSPQQFNAWYRRDGFQRPVHDRVGFDAVAHTILGQGQGTSQLVLGIIAFYATAALGASIGCWVLALFHFKLAILRLTTIELLEAKEMKDRGRSPPPGMDIPETSVARKIIHVCKEKAHNVQNTLTQLRGHRVADSSGTSSAIEAKEECVRHERSETGGGGASYTYSP